MPMQMIFNMTKNLILGVPCVIAMFYFLRNNVDHEFFIVLNNAVTKRKHSSAFSIHQQYEVSALRVIALFHIFPQSVFRIVRWSKYSLSSSKCAPLYISSSRNSSSKPSFTASCTD